jgi:muramoyltetrapeptide carboxypeptidase
MRIVKPTALRPGDVIGICAPASAPPPDDSLSRGIRYLERLGYRIKPGKYLHRSRGYLAGTDAERASDLNALFADPKVKAIFTARGGYGSQRILPLLDYGLIRRHPKIVVGYSDITAIQLALLGRTGLVTFSGPMVASNLSSGLRGKAEEIFWDLLTSRRPAAPVKARNLPTRRKIRPGKPDGRLIGGNLAMLAASVGTSYFPVMRDVVLFFEEVAEAPYRIDRMLRQMKLASVLENPRGILLGAFVDCKPDKRKPSLSLRDVFLDTFSEHRYPVLQGLHYGHVKNSLTLPIGVRVRLDSVKGRIEFLEGAVE